MSGRYWDAIYVLCSVLGRLHVYHSPMDVRWLPNHPTSGHPPGTLKDREQRANQYRGRETKFPDG